MIPPCSLVELPSTQIMLPPPGYLFGCPPPVFRRLDSMLFGLVNEFDVSMCLMAYQMGRPLPHDCDCTKHEKAGAAEIGHVRGPRLSLKS